MATVERSIRTVLAAARAEADAGRFVEALDLLASAPLDDIDASDRYDVEIERCRFLDRLGRYAESLSHAELALDVATSMGDHGRAARAASLGAGVAVHFPDLTRSVDLAVGALVMVEEPGVDPYLHAVTLTNVGYLLAALGAPAQGARLTERAVRLMEAIDPLPEGVHLARLNVATYLGVLDASYDPGQSPLRHVVGSGLRKLVEDPAVPPSIAAIAASELAIGLLREGEWARAEAVLDGVDLEACRSIARAQPPLRRLEGLLAQQRGEHADALAALDDAVALAAEQRVRWMIPHVHDDRARSLLALGDAAGAADALRAGLRESLRTGFERVEQVVGQMLERADAERERRTLAQRSADLVRTNEEDPLTNLGNRRAFDRLCREEPDAVCALMVCDLDHFKRINDGYGHSVGDAVLLRCARALRAALRPGDLLVRWGGEEFLAVVLTEDLTLARLVAERMRTTVMGERWDGLLPRGDHPTISIGVTMGRLRDARELFSRADTALYRAKAEGRDRVVLDV